MYLSNPKGNATLKLNGHSIVPISSFLDGLFDRGAFLIRD